jgi:hypothetical protein
MGGRSGFGWVLSWRLRGVPPRGASAALRGRWWWWFLGVFGVFLRVNVLKYS